MSDVKLEPCPLCKKQPVQVGFEAKGRDYQYYACHHCKLASIDEDTDKGARDNWNEMTRNIKRI